MTKIKNIIIIGCSGRMGRELLQIVLKSPNTLRLVGATEKAGSPHVGRDAASLIGHNPCHTLITDSLASAIKALPTLDQVPVIIDFTFPSVTLAHLPVAVEKGLPMVIGTTGFDKKDIETLSAASHKIPLLVSPNMSVGVNTLFHLVNEAARILQNGFDIEITEAHHRLKKDAPSGTAVRLAEIVAAGRNLSYPENFNFHRQGLTGERKENEIGMQVIRGGDIVGEHDVLFCGMGEKLSISHIATNRAIFAEGAVVAASWLAEKTPGFYRMSDVLGITK